MQTVKNETTVKNLVFEGFLQTSIPPLNFIFSAKKGGITTFRSEFFVSRYRKISLGNTLVYQKISGIEKL